jgi:hypothetical protein
MHSFYPAADLLRAAVAPVKEKEPTTRKPTLDGVDDVLNTDECADAQDYAATNLALVTAAALQDWAETDDLDEGETLADRLQNTLVGIVDPDQDGDELTDDEQDVLGLTLEAAGDYLASKGVAEDDISALLNDWDPDAATRIQDLLISTLPNGDEAAADDLDDFAFSDDSATMDAAYAMKSVVRGGKKMRIKKRISGSVKLSPKQKLAIRKAQKKAHSAGAMSRRLRSLRKEGLAK